MLLVKIVVCCYSRDVIVQVGLVCVEGVVHIKYCNHLLAVDMAGVACRGLWCACWKNVKRYRDGSP